MAVARRIKTTACKHKALENDWCCSMLITTDSKVACHCWAPNTLAMQTEFPEQGGPESSPGKLLVLAFWSQRPLLAPPQGPMDRLSQKRNAWLVSSG